MDPRPPSPPPSPPPSRHTPEPPPDVVARLRAAGCVFAEAEARLLVSAARTPAEINAMVERRSTGVPLEHVVGWAWFSGLRIALDPGVFIPRHRTEFLVDQAAAHIRQAGDRIGQGAGGSDAVVVDLCCGSGAVGVALAARLQGARLCAVDVDPVAVRCARRNVAVVGGEVYEGDLYEPLPATLRGRVTVVTACAPYVPSDEIRLLPSEARLHEPRLALDGGTDGLDILRRVIEEAPRWLVGGGHVVVETSDRQAPHAAEAATASGLIPRVVTSDELEATVVVATKPRGSGARATEPLRAPASASFPGGDVLAGHEAPSNQRGSG